MGKDTTCRWIKEGGGDLGWMECNNGKRTWYAAPCEKDAQYSDGVIDCQLTKVQGTSFATYTNTVQAAWIVDKSFIACTPASTR
jgi:hypothetical protein